MIGIAGTFAKKEKYHGTVMYEMQKTKDKKKLARFTEAFLKMKKFDIAELQRAYTG